MTLSNPRTRRAIVDLSVDSMKSVTNIYNEYLDDVAWNIAKARYLAEQNNRKINE